MAKRHGTRDFGSRTQPNLSSSSGAFEKRGDPWSTRRESVKLYGENYDRDAELSADEQRHRGKSRLKRKFKREGFSRDKLDAAIDKTVAEMKEVEYDAGLAIALEREKQKSREAADTLPVRSDEEQRLADLRRNLAGKAVGLRRTLNAMKRKPIVIAGNTGAFTTRKSKD